MGAQKLDLCRFAAAVDAFKRNQKTHG
jgi:hypothetical protein